MKNLWHKLPKKKSWVMADGVLPIYKPQGFVSKDVSRLLEKKFGRMKIGHVGTLDPVAEGVLPILLGRATRLQDYLLILPKAYRFIVKWGELTDSLDISGQVIEKSPKQDCSSEEISIVIKDFMGVIWQQPPSYSAVKYKGQPLYKYARAQKLDEVDFKALARQVQIFSLQLCETFKGGAEFYVRCSKGTYVRQLAVDIAKKLGTLATVTKICREEAAGFMQDQCVALDEVLESDSLADHILSLEHVDCGLPKWRAPRARWCEILKNGRKLCISEEYFSSFLLPSAARNNMLGTENNDPGQLFVTDDQGTLLGIACYFKKDNHSVEITMKRGFV